MEKAGRHEHVIGIPVSNRAFGIEESDFPSISWRREKLCSRGYKLQIWQEREHARSGHQRTCDSRTKTVRDHERQADAGRENPPGRRRGEGLPAVVRRRERREAPEGLPVLSVHHGRPDRRHALHIDGEDRLPERTVAGADHREGRNGAGAVQGGHPSEEGEDGQAEREQAPAGAEVRRGGDRRRLRVLVLGFRQLPVDPEEPGAGRRAGAVIDL